MDFIDISLFLSYNIYRQQCMLHRKSITVRRGTMIEQLYVDLNLRPDLEIIANDGDFDWVIVLQTLQEMRRPDVILQRIVRVGKRAAVSFINFGHIACRLQLLATGRICSPTSLRWDAYSLLRKKQSNFCIFSLAEIFFRINKIK